MQLAKVLPKNLYVRLSEEEIAKLNESVAQPRSIGLYQLSSQSVLAQEIYQIGKDSWDTYCLYVHNKDRKLEKASDVKGWMDEMCGMNGGRVDMVFELKDKIEICMTVAADRGNVEAMHFINDHVSAFDFPTPKINR